jgi:hypothetical protein
MKFYKGSCNNLTYNKIIDNKLIAVYLNFYNSILFFKNGKYHNSKSSAIIHTDGYKYFYFYGKCYGNNFTKSSWRKFAKLQTFL